MAPAELADDAREQCRLGGENGGSRDGHRRSRPLCVSFLVFSRALVLIGEHALADERVHDGPQRQAGRGDFLETANDAKAKANG